MRFSLVILIGRIKCIKHNKNEKNKHWHPARCVGPDLGLCINYVARSRHYLYDYGIYSIVGYFLRNKEDEVTPPLFPLDGLGSLLLGGWLLLMPNFFVNILMYLLGAVLVLAGIQQISTLIRARKWSVVPYVFYILPSLILLVGVMILVYPMDIMANTLTIFGVATLFYGANELINWYKFRKRDYIQID